MNFRFRFAILKKNDMNAFFDKPIGVAEKKEERYRFLCERLEYPEVIADKGLYLCYLNEQTTLLKTHERLSALKNVLSLYEKTNKTYLSLPQGEEKDLFAAETSSLYRKAISARSELVASLLRLGEKTDEESVSCKISCSSGKTCEDFFSSLKTYAKASRLTLSNEKKNLLPGEKFAREILFSCNGADAFAKAEIFTGAHTVLTASAEKVILRFTAVPTENEPVFPDGDFKIELFHSSGAGGQNINKVETAVRVVHLPTGTAVTCQDERSQLKNKNRALETIKNRLFSSWEREERERVRLLEKEQLGVKKGDFTIDERKRTLLSLRSKKEYPFPFSPSDAEKFAEEKLLKDDND